MGWMAESTDSPILFRLKPGRGYRYLQISRSVRRGKTARQEIIATLGRLDVLRESRQLDSLLRSGLPLGFAEIVGGLAGRRTHEFDIWSGQYT